MYEGLLREVAHPGCNLATVTQQGVGCGLLPRTREEGKKGRRSFGEREKNETCFTSENMLYFLKPLILGPCSWLPRVGTIV